MDKKNNWAWGVPGITFIWHGEWADPEIAYKDHLFNFRDVEDAIADMLSEDYDLDWSDDISDADWDAWVKDNHETIRGLLDEWIVTGRAVIE